MLKAKGVNGMATSSILKSVNIKGRKSGRTFIDALAKSKKRKSKTVKMSRPHREVTGSTIKELFK